MLPSVPALSLFSDEASECGDHESEQTSFYDREVPEHVFGIGPAICHRAFPFG